MDLGAAPRGFAVFDDQTGLDVLFEERPASSSGEIGLWKPGMAWRISSGFFCQ